MNPYAMLASRAETSEAEALCARLRAWHDSMVEHERRLRNAASADACGEDCPHGEAATLWAEALANFGIRAHALDFLRTRAMGAPVN
jgi:hypothetical protein